MTKRKSTEESDSRRFLSQRDCAALCKRIEGFTDGSGVTKISIRSSWISDVRWARNRITVVRDWQDNDISIGRYGGAGSNLSSWTGVNQVDDLSLRSAVQAAESKSHLQDDSWARIYNTAKDVSVPREEPAYPHTAIWSDTTYAMTANSRISITNTLANVAERAGMLSAGYIAVEARGIAEYPVPWGLLYAPQTLVQCSVTVRDPDGTGSGWAGRSSYDWNRFDAQQLATIAVDKCLKSRNPVRIEPGRYTLIMEPQATCDFILTGLWGTAAPVMLKSFEESYEDSPYYASPEMVLVSRFGRPTKVSHTKIGQQIFDKRVSIGFDPSNPDLGVVPWGGFDYQPVGPITWFDHGILNDLSYISRNGHPGVVDPGAQWMSGGTTTIDEMIATTKRGLLVTRFSGVRQLDLSSLLYTGYTRDGLWLIENGKISKPVKNFRFTESPLFALNNLEQLGVPVPVFRPGYPAIVPPIKVRDFSFTSTIDAI